MGIVWEILEHIYYSLLLHAVAPFGLGGTAEKERGGGDHQIRHFISHISYIRIHCISRRIKDQRNACTRKRKRKGRTAGLCNGAMVQRCGGKKGEETMARYLVKSFHACKEANVEFSAYFSCRATIPFVSENARSC